jgi:Ti-type conjugative transfer relaxase TraA
VQGQVLSIGKLTGPDSDRYYSRTVAKGREDYYTGRGEARGYWAGSAVDLLLESDGEVSDEAFAALLAGRSPAGGAPLRSSTTTHSVSGYDLTFKAPKSVSILYGVGSDEVSRAVREAHDGAVAEALGYLERTACWTRRGAGGKTVLQGRGFVAGAFRHRTSRAGDPALHTHVVVGNVTEAEGRWSALDGRLLYRHAKTAGYLYQAALRASLTEHLGVQWTTVTNGAADVLGVPREVIDQFSQRRAEILEHMAARGEHSAAAAQIAALETRRSKDHDVPVDRLRANWRARAEEYGFGPQELADAVNRRERFGESNLARARVGVDQLTMDELTHESSTFDRRDVLRACASRERGGAHVHDVERNADAWLASPAAVPLERGRPGPWGRRFSTPEMLATERELLTTAMSRRAEGAGVVSQSDVDDLLRKRPELNAEQAAMVRDLTTSGDGVQVVRAAAGTGNTYALDAARQAWEQAGFKVYGAALSARAAIELRDQAGMETSTLARLRADLRSGHNLTPNTVLVLDEAGTVGTRDLAEVARHADEMGAKLVLAGDDRQLPEIDAGGAFRALAKTLGASELREVRRQREAWDREAHTALREGKVDPWFDAYRDHDRLRGGRDAAGTRALLADDWWRAVREDPACDAVMVAHRRSDVEDLNRRARERLTAGGALGPDEVLASGRAFAAGDRVVACRNDRRAGVANGTRGWVREVHEERHSVTVEFDGRDRVELGAGYLDEGHLDHGYALTAHRAQGSTVDRAFVLGSDELYREWGYTALTRHRDSAFFYMNGAEGQLPLPGLGPDEAAPSDLVDPLRRSRAKEMALEVLRDPALEAESSLELDMGP